MACCRKLSHRQTFYTPKNFTGLSDTQLGDSWRNEMGPRLEECPRECPSFGFKSQAQPTYTSVPSAMRGRDPAAPNVALAVVLQDTPMWNTRCRLMMAILDILPPARSSMQRRSGAAGQAVTGLNKQELQRPCDCLTQCWKWSGKRMQCISVRPRFDKGARSSSAKECFP